MLEFLLGSASIVAPSGLQVPLIAGYCLTKCVKTIAKRRRRKRQDTELESTQHGVVLEWRGLDLTLQASDSKPTKKILSGVNGKALPGRLMAVMGPSGAGKTSLLNALARQVPYSAKASFTGTIEVNGVEVSTDDAVRQAYVQQEDLFYSQLTLRETLTMACSLRLPASAAKEEAVEELIRKLGLTSCADSFVGDAKTRGLSGGEKKRLSIGCELLNSPALMFLDEPTTGLDAFQSVKVVESLKTLAQDGRTVICTVHQPRSSVFEMFDDLVLLANGQVVYSGISARALEYFQTQGFHCPEHYNPAEFFADLISIDCSSVESEKASKDRVARLIENWKKTDSAQYQFSPSKEDSSQVVNGFMLNTGEPRRSNWFRDFRLLFGRSWKQARRDKKTNFARLGMNLGSALIFGGIYFQMKMISSAVQDRVGLLQLAAVNTAMSSLVKTVNIFPSEQTIVTRERSKKAYGVLPYLCGKILSDIPVGLLLSCTFGCVLYTLTGLNPAKDRAMKFMGLVVMESFASAALGLAVGSVAPSTEIAVMIGPMVMLLFIVFGGYYVNADNTLKVLRWVPDASLIQNAFQGLCINEFTGVEFEQEDCHKERGMMKNGKDVLAWLGFDGIPVEKPLIRNSKVMLFNYWLTYNILNAKKPRFTPLKKQTTNNASSSRA